ncbi:MAG: hypothetical protein DWQ37_12925 [Planctomycetota bacterium]|nr:MAG: hypothetical protein DWQ37_12925 [Planctomycetota bacterium]
MQRLYLLLLLLLLIAGCGLTPESKLVGRWEGKPTALAEQAAQDSKLPKLGAGLVKALADQLVFYVDFRRDGTYQADFGNNEVTGKWEVVKAEGNTIVVAMSVAGNASERTFTIDSPDQMTLDGAVTLTRARP